jgi:hypothetical protein
MSRSRRKRPFRGITTCESEKEDKQHAHRAYRHAVKQHMKLNPKSETIPNWREYSDPWSWGKDGKMLIRPEWEKLMRK